MKPLGRTPPPNLVVSQSRSSNPTEGSKNKTVAFTNPSADMGQTQNLAKLAGVPPSQVALSLRIPGLETIRGLLDRMTPKELSEKQRASIDEMAFRDLGGPSRVEPGTDFELRSRAEVEAFLEETYAESLAANGRIDLSVCDPMTSLINHELFKAHVPFRRIDGSENHTLANKNPDLNLYHAHTRVPTKENLNGGLIVDGTIGQFFEGEGAPRPKGGFEPQKNGIATYSYDDLISAFENNLDKLSGNTSLVVLGMRGRDSSITDRQIAEQLVELYYGVRETTGDHPSLPAWTEPSSPEQLEIYRAGSTAIDRFYELSR